MGPWRHKKVIIFCFPYRKQHQHLAVNSTSWTQIAGKLWYMDGLPPKICFYPILSPPTSAGTNPSLLAELHVRDPLRMLWHLPSFAITAPRVNSHTTSSINGFANLFSTNEFCPNDRATWDSGLKQSHKNIEIKRHDPHHSSSFPTCAADEADTPTQEVGSSFDVIIAFEESNTHRHIHPQRPSKRRHRLHPWRPTCTHSHCLPA